MGDGSDTPQLEVYCRGASLVKRRSLTDGEASFLEARRRQYWRGQALWIGVPFLLSAISVLLALGLHQDGFYGVVMVAIVTVPAALALRARDRAKEIRWVGEFHRQQGLVCEFVYPENSVSSVKSFDVLYPPGVLIRLDGVWLPQFVTVDIVEVAGEPESAVQTAQWAEAMGEPWASRPLSTEERGELERSIHRNKFRFQWWMVFFYLYCSWAAIALVLGVAQKSGNGFGAVFAVMVGMLSLRAVLRGRRIRSLLADSLRFSEIKVVIAEGKDGATHRAEYLVPHGLEWSLDGQPARWRR